MERNRLKISLKMTLERKLYIGIPRGSLNRDSRKEPNRGDTRLLLREAGWELAGYYYKREKYYPKIVKAPEDLKDVKFFVMRPRDFPSLLAEGYLDLAICGNDLMEEWYSSIWPEGYTNQLPREFTKINKKRKAGIFPSDIKEFRKKYSYLQTQQWYKTYEEWYLDTKYTYPRLSEEFWHKNLNLIKRSMKGKKESLSINFTPYEICNLGYGKVRLFFAIDKKEKKILKKIISAFEEIGLERITEMEESLACSTEYPKIAFGQFCKYIPPGLIEIDYSQHRFTYFGQQKPIVITPRHGNETAIPMFASQIILECVSSGTTLDENNLVTIGKSILTSTARLYRGPKEINWPAFYIERIKKNIGFFNIENRNRLDLRELEEAAVSTGDSKWKQEKIQEVSDKLQNASRKLGWLK